MDLAYRRHVLLELLTSHSRTDLSHGRRCAAIRYHLTWRPWLVLCSRQVCKNQTSPNWNGRR